MPRPSVEPEECSPLELDFPPVRTFKSDTPRFIARLVIRPPFNGSATCPPLSVPHAATIPLVVIANGTDVVIVLVLMVFLAIAGTKC